MLFLFDSDWVKSIWIIFCRWNLNKIPCNQVGYMLFICGFCVSLWKVIYWVVDVFICYFLYKVPNFGGGFVWEFILEMKVLQEDLLASLMICWVFALCSLHLFRFSDEEFVLNFLRVAWRSLIMFLHSSGNHGLLCLGDIVVLWIVLFAMLMKVLVKCIMGSSWFVFDSGISVVRHSFL